jgi:TrmH family RNA methyltransferase
LDQLKRPLSRAEIKQIRALKQRKHREAQSLFLAEGVRVVEDLLVSPVAIRMVLVASSLEDNPRGRVLLDEVGHRSIPVRQLPNAELAELTGTDTPQGIIAVAEMPRSTLRTLDVLTGDAVLLLLDAVQDPGNLGTLVRTAEALGAGGIVMLPGTVDPWNPKAVRAAMGATFRVPIIPAGWEDLAPWLRENGYHVLAAATGGAPVQRPRGRVALVVGNEGAGISPEAMEHADTRVGIPLRGRAESLNVAAAAAILLYELLR